VKQRIDAVVRLLFNPNCNSPLNGRAACLYEENYTDYCKIAFLIFRGVEKLDEYVKR
jgi:ubiquitin-protein ligase